MGFFDLNIPYHESDLRLTDKSFLKGRRLMLALKAMELGFTGVAYNCTLRGIMSESDRCSTTIFPLSKLAASSSALIMTIKFHRELLNVAVSSPFRQYTRLTVIVDYPAQLAALKSGNPILKSYDIVAVRPTSKETFELACQTSEVDMIFLDFSDTKPFTLRQPMVKAAIKRGIYFEITYSGLISDAQSRQRVISNSKNDLRNNALQLASEEQKKADENVLLLVEDQKREKQEALKNIHELERNLDEKQTLEMGIQELKGKTRGDDDGAIQKKIHEMNQQLKEKEEDFEGLEDLN